MSLPRVDIFVDTLVGGGAERVCVVTANDLVALGYDVRLVVSDLTNAVYLNRVDPRIPVATFHKRLSRRTYGTLAAYLTETQPLLCLSHDFRVSIALAAVRTLHRFPIRIIGVVHNIPDKMSQVNARTFYSKRIAPLLYRQIYPQIDRVVSVSAGLGQWMVSRYSVAPHKLTTIYNPVDPILDAKAQQAIDRMSSGIPRRNVFAIGRMTYQKGFDRLLAAFALCLRQNPELCLHFAGDGELRDVLTQQAVQLGIADAVMFHGFVREVAQVYQQADLVVSSSYYEAMPMVMIETMAFGKPVVAFDCDFGPREIIIDGVNGFLVPQDDIPALAQAMMHALDYSWDAARIRATTYRFNHLEIAQQYAALIKRFSDS